jgi:hypothetical protein
VKTLFATRIDAVARYDRVMAELMPVLKASEAQLGALTSRASALGESAQLQLESAHALVAEIRRRALDDPLAV